MKTPIHLMLLAATLGLASLGCRTPRGAGSENDRIGPFGPLPNLMDWGAEEEPKTAEPERVVATWIDTVRQQPGEQAERGFGGRLYFYDDGSKPVRVDGRLVVYAFDETDRLPTDHKPTRRFIFPAEQLAKHMSESEIGPSYSVWLPWDGTQGPATEVSLIARFEPTRGGGLIASDQATQWLPGQPGIGPGQGINETQIATSQPSSVQQAGFAERTEAAKPSNGEPRRRLSTTTIQLQR